MPRDIYQDADLFKIISRYMEKKLFIQLNGGRKVTGILRGYDPFMNLVVDETVEEISPAERHNIGMVVSFLSSGSKIPPPWTWVTGSII